MQKTIYTCGVMALTAASSAMALTIDEVASRDFDGDGQIERGPEADALEGALDQMSAFQQVRFLNDFIEEGKASVPVTEFDDENLYYERLDAECKVKKRFFLQDSISSISLLNPRLFTPSKDGAKFSLTDNRESRTTTWETSGALAWLPQSIKKCLGTGERVAPRGVSLTGYAIAPVLRFDGNGTSGEDDESTLQFGLLTQFQYFGGRTFSLQELSVTPYFQTDFEGRAKIYGLLASWKPYNFKPFGNFGERLNGLRTPVTKPNTDWTLVVNAEFQTVKKAGLSGLTEGEEKGWIGFETGVGYFAPKFGKHGTRFAADLTHDHDILNDVSATSYSLSATTFLADLNEDARPSLQLLYEKGRDKTLEDVDSLTMTLRFAF
jgi:hypothetical protein